MYGGYAPPSGRSSNPFGVPSGPDGGRGRRPRQGRCGDERNGGQWSSKSLIAFIKD